MCHPYSAVEKGTEQALNLIEGDFNFAQCPILIYIVSND